MLRCIERDSAIPLLICAGPKVSEIDERVCAFRQTVQPQCVGVNLVPYRLPFHVGGYCRSPVLAIVSGMAALLITNLSVFQRTLDYKQEVGAEMLFFLPVSLTFTTTYILRGLRLLALYNPDPNSRQRSIKYLKEWFFVKILLAVFLTVEGAMWAFVPTYGINT